MGKRKRESKLTGADAVAARRREALGAAIAAARRAASPPMTQERFVALADISTATLKRLEAGHAVTMASYERVLAALGMPWAELTVDRRPDGTPVSPGEAAAVRVRDAGLTHDEAGDLDEVLALGSIDAGRELRRVLLRQAREVARAARAQIPSAGRGTGGAP